MGKLYEVGFYFSPASLNFHLATRPCRWIGRLGDDLITPMKILETEGKLSLNLPIIKIEQATLVGKGDMSLLYRSVFAEYENTPLM